MQRPRSPYQVLNVSPDAEPEVIEAAYKILMKKYHPDMRGGGQERAAEINQAFNLLRDPDRRARHDADEKARRPVVAGGERPAYQGPRGTVPFSPVGAYARRRHRLLAGWAAILFLALAIGAALTVTRDTGGAAAQAIGKSVRAAAERVQDVAAGNPGQDGPAISRDRINEAVGVLHRVRALYGSNGVAAYSDACFDALSRTRNVHDFDFCVAFDHAASAYEYLPADAGILRFTEAQLTLRHVGAARGLPQDYSSVEERLRDIRSLTAAALARDANEDLQQPPIARSTPRPRRTELPRSRSSRQPAPRPAGQAEDADFLERQGGIY